MYFGKIYCTIWFGQKVHNTFHFGCIYALYSPPKYIYKGVINQHYIFGKKEGQRTKHLFKKILSRG